ncbi:MAG: hypothetical protein KGZ39_06915 [Simkania sp.]|nr:hypothetical protein [Simkania sp.]
MKTILNGWLKEEKLKAHKTSKEEVAQLLKIIDRDLSDAIVHGLSADRRFITAYNAALQLSTLALRVHGLRTNPNKAGHHRISIDALPEILGKDHQELADYLNACRIKRNTSDYTSSGEISEKEVVEIIGEVKKFKTFIIQWIRSTHPQFLPK